MVFEPMSVVSIKVSEGVCSIKSRAICLEKTRKLIHIIVISRINLSTALLELSTFLKIYRTSA